MGYNQFSPSLTRFFTALTDDLAYPDPSTLDMFVGSLKFMDYESQLIAIRQLLDQHRQTAGHALTELRTIEEIAENSASERIVDDRVDLLHGMVYQDIAHSMAAVGLIVPFLESLFGHVFHFVGQKADTSGTVIYDHERWRKSAKRRWDCCYQWRNGSWKRSTVEGILQLAHLSDMARHLPRDLKSVLSALYAYRNKMFHCGLEWPIDEREGFEERLTRENWPCEWFAKARTGDDPWVFYMSPEFVDHCLLRIEEIADGVGAYFHRLYHQ